MEPPPPYPPPPPFVPITSKNVEDQIGLLKPYFQERLAGLAPSSAPPPVLGMPLIPPPPGVAVPTTEPMDISASPMLLTLPDDPPPASQTKLGPIGQIMKSGPSTGAVKKKAKAPPKDAGGGPIPIPTGLLTLRPEDVPMEPIFNAEILGDGGQRDVKGPMVGGSGNSGKKKTVNLPPVIAASA